MEHPSITRTRDTGYPTPEPKSAGEDIYGNEVLEGDAILIIDSKQNFIARHELDEKMAQVLIGLGAEESIA